MSLTLLDLDTLLESLGHSKNRVRNSEGPYEVRRLTLDRLDAVSQKLRDDRRELARHVKTLSSATKRVRS